MVTFSSVVRKSLRIAASSALMIGGALVASVVMSPAAAAAEPVPPGMTCPAANIWVNTPTELIEYSPSGVQVRTFPLTNVYGDIAWSADGSTLYGIRFDTSDKDAADVLLEPTLYSIDLADPTDPEENVIPISGDLSLSAFIKDYAIPGTQLNSLTALPDGDLLVGSAGSQAIFRLHLDPAGTSATSSIYGTYKEGLDSSPITAPDSDAHYSSAGDFLTLNSKNMLAIGNDTLTSGASSMLFRIDLATNGITEVGAVPQTFGAAQSGGAIYFATASGLLLRLDEVPTAESSAPLDAEALTIVANTGKGFYGATSIQDAGECNIQVPTSFTVEKSADGPSPARVGDTITYIVTIKNTGDYPYFADGAGFTDDLTNVLDSAELVPGSITASAGKASLSGSTLTWSGPLAVGPDPAWMATVTYQVKVTTAPATLTNTVTPTGVGGSCSAAGDCTTETDVVSDGGSGGGSGSTDTDPGGVPGGSSTDTTNPGTVNDSGNPTNPGGAGDGLAVCDPYHPSGHVPGSDSLATTGSDISSTAEMGLLLVSMGAGALALSRQARSRRRPE